LPSLSPLRGERVRLRTECVTLRWGLGFRVTPMTRLKLLSYEDWATDPVALDSGVVIRFSRLEIFLAVPATALFATSMPL
jgi:hypothetical protein